MANPTRVNAVTMIRSKNRSERDTGSLRSKHGNCLLLLLFGVLVVSVADVVAVAAAAAVCNCLSPEGWMIPGNNSGPRHIPPSYQFFSSAVALVAAKVVPVALLRILAPLLNRENCCCVSFNSLAILTKPLYNFCLRSFSLISSTFCLDSFSLSFLVLSRSFCSASFVAVVLVLVSES